MNCDIDPAYQFLHFYSPLAPILNKTQTFSLSNTNLQFSEYIFILS